MEATNLARADSDHTLSRIESFSDIVIGFSLAQTALNLFIPPHPADFITRPIGIIGFTFTFAVIATFWWTHSAIFRHFFVINRMMVFFNFVALALIVLQVFALQMWLHFGASTTDDVEAARIYFGIFALTQVTLALLPAGHALPLERVAPIFAASRNAADDSGRLPRGGHPDRRARAEPSPER